VKRPLIVHRAAERRFAPWRNGGGETAEILCHPQGAGPDDFGWRISTARVARSGPFSHFPGVARCLAVIEGGVLRLRLPDRSLDVEPDGPPVEFAGDLPCDCRLIGPAVLDLNLMTRAPFKGRLRRRGSPAADPGRLAACFIFKGIADPGNGLERHDLVDASGLADAEREALLSRSDLLIEVFETTR
jgi:uncharacterized protein